MTDLEGGGLRVKIGHHKIGACAEIGQNRIRGGWGVKKSQKTSDIIYVRSLRSMFGVLGLYNFATYPPSLMFHTL